MMTEHRAGTYVYNDVMMVQSGVGAVGQLRHARARDGGELPDRRIAPLSMRVRRF